MVAVLGGGRRAALCRADELHEEVRRGTLDEIARGWTTIRRGVRWCWSSTARAEERRTPYLSRLRWRRQWRR